MKIIKNALSDTLFQKCKEEINEKLPKNVWASSTMIWPPELRQGISGNTMASMMSPETTELIKQEIKEYIPECEVVAQYYIWQPHSGIAMHNDQSRKFGATIYMNEKWHPNSGGWFIWQDKNTEEWNTILPEENVMVVNDTSENHLVTSVAPDGFAIRITIQIWGLL